MYTYVYIPAHTLLSLSHFSKTPFSSSSRVPSLLPSQLYVPLHLFPAIPPYTPFPPFALRLLRLWRALVFFRVFALFRSFVWLFFELEVNIRGQKKEAAAAAAKRNSTTSIEEVYSSAKSRLCFPSFSPVVSPWLIFLFFLSRARTQLSSLSRFVVYTLYFAAARLLRGM